MNIEQLKQTGLFLLLLLAQGLVCNNIHLFQVATPFVCVFLVIKFRRGTAKWAVLLWSFLMGLGTDLFANTPGVAAGSMTFIALLQPMLLELFIPRDSDENLKPSTKSMGAGFLWYSLFIVFTYCLLFYTLQMFSFFNWLLWLECIGGSALLSYILIFALEKAKG